jgi:hypothetical protein
MKTEPGPSKTNSRGRTVVNSHLWPKTMIWSKVTKPCAPPRTGDPFRRGRCREQKKITQQRLPHESTLELIDTQEERSRVAQWPRHHVRREAIDSPEVGILWLVDTQEERSKVAWRPRRPVWREANDSPKACILRLIDTREERSKVAWWPRHPAWREANDSPKACILRLPDTQEERSKVARWPHRPAWWEANDSPKAYILWLIDTQEERSKVAWRLLVVINHQFQTINKIWKRVNNK